MYGFSSDAVKRSRIKHLDEGPQLCTQALQFHVKGVFADYTYPIAYFTTTGVSAAFLEQQIWEGVRLLYTRGFRVLIITFDGCGSNRSVMNSTKAMFSGITQNFITGDPLFVLPDAPHIAKKMRNSFADSNRQLRKRNENGNVDMIKWSDVEKLYNATRGPIPGLRLTAAHFKLNSYTKMDVQKALDIFKSDVYKQLPNFVPDSEGTVSMRYFTYLPLKLKGGNTLTLSFYCIKANIFIAHSALLCVEFLCAHVRKLSSSFYCFFFAMVPSLIL